MSTIPGMRIGVSSISPDHAGALMVAAQADRCYDVFQRFLPENRFFSDWGFALEDTAWVRQVLDSVDGMDTEAFLGFLTDDARFRFGSAAIVAGKDAIRQAVNGFFGTIKALRHKILETWSQGQTVICQGQVTYTRTDDSDVTLPFMTLWRLQGKRIGEYLIYIDSTPLFAPTS